MIDELLEKKLDLLINMKDNTLLLSKAIDEKDDEQILKRVEFNDYHLKLINDLDLKAKTIGEVLLNDQIQLLSKEIYDLSKDNKKRIESFYLYLKKKVNKVSKNVYASNAYVSNITE